eukprot:7322311-Prymnesium_polylepis.1
MGRDSPPALRLQCPCLGPLSSVDAHRPSTCRLRAREPREAGNRDGCADAGRRASGGGTAHAHSSWRQGTAAMRGK